MSPFLISGIWSDLLSSFKVGVRRVKTEDGSTSLSLGYRFRAFDEFSLANGEQEIIKVVSPIDFDLTGLIINLESGGIRYEAVVNVTSETGFTTPVPVYPLNTRSDKEGSYINQITAFQDGAITGGTVADLALIKTGTNNQRVSLVEGVQTIRSLPAGTYYLKVTATTNNANGVIYSNWSEM